MKTSTSINPGTYVPGLYQCYGLVSHLLDQMADWLNAHPSEVVLLTFGNIEYPGETVPRLGDALREAFPAQGDGVRMNRAFKETGSWPLLGEAVASNERVIVFIRDTVGVVGEEDLEFVREVKVKPGQEVERNETDTVVYVTTSYQARTVTNCGYVLETSRTACQSEQLQGTDFLKLSLFSKFGKGGVLGLQCLHTMAKKCNQWTKGSLASCDYKKFRPNMLVVDYPNYQGQAEYGLVELVDQENFRRAASLKEGSELS